MNQVTITYHGHACFSLECGGYRTVIDPYQEGMIPGLPALSLEAEAVVCSHDHGDHAYVQAVSLKTPAGEAPYSLECLLTAHDDQGGALRGKNLVHLFDFGGLRVAHLGDLGEIPSDAVFEKLKGVDCLMIPVGGFYTIGPDQAQQIADRVDATVTIPMHYRTDNTGIEVLNHLHDFTDRFRNVNYCDNRVILHSNMEKQILVIHYKP